MFSSSRRAVWRNEVRGQVLPASVLRRELVRPGDLRNEIGFQNDINILLAALDEGAAIWSLEAPLLSPDQGLPEYDDGPTTLTDLKATAECAVDPQAFASCAA